MSTQARLLPPPLPALRRAATAALPPGAFLRRDRGRALYVSDAPRRRPDLDWVAASAEAGFSVEIRDGLAYLTPDARWLASLEAQTPVPPNALCDGLLRFRGLPAEPESLALFARIARAIEGGEALAPLDRRLRQRAAVCLRLNGRAPSAPHGGGLYACGVLLGKRD